MVGGRTKLEFNQCSTENIIEKGKGESEQGHRVNSRNSDWKCSGIFRLCVDETLYVSNTVTVPDSFRRGTLYLIVTITATVTVTPTVYSNFGR
ncbi:DNA damage checkpoint control MEC3 [Gossypium arboreum]|uniref:DNA damage checkpoint control MEC3 n=1 Tax=Gossypium arboreum TaxID=29729 RepID=A0A0B0NZ40_GOSAR|nr:DNA damage checkpoint control MEC3 [Gossypium arboreum]KHG25538.1 DNA damage checkpoint control MEC3 [Gossypium arboreum]